MNTGIIVIIALLVALVVYIFARDSGKKSPIVWLISGFFSALLVLITIGAIRKKK
ncbi:MAG: hypothetical protein WCK59_03055 [Candidatus Falkowbacteria bacterium]